MANVNERVRLGESISAQVTRANGTVEPEPTQENRVALELLTLLQTLRSKKAPSP
jgi:hypothetical protein